MPQIEHEDGRFEIIQDRPRKRLAPLPDSDVVPLDDDTEIAA